MEPSVTKLVPRFSFGRIPVRPQGTAVTAVSEEPEGQAKPRQAADTPTRKPIFRSAFSLSKVPVVAAADQNPQTGPVFTSPDRDFDFFNLEGFTRVDNEPGPIRVSPDVWSKVFPPDRPRVLVLVGRYFMQGQDPDAAVDRAIGECQNERWIGLAEDPRLNALAEAFEITLDGVPPQNLQTAFDGVYWTAHLSHDAILAAPDPIRAAFSHRAWRAPAGRCLVCGQSTNADDRRFRVAATDASDAIHKGCLAKMGKIGPVFGRMVVAEAEGVVARRPPMAPAETGADPENPATFIDAA